MTLSGPYKALRVSFVSCRCLYMKEFMLGLSSYGLDQMIIQNPLVCQPLFVAGDLKKDITLMLTISSHF